MDWIKKFLESLCINLIENINAAHSASLEILALQKLLRILLIAVAPDAPYQLGIHIVIDGRPLANNIVVRINIDN